jgi:hypothetical protein
MALKVEESAPSVRTQFAGAESRRQLNDSFRIAQNFPPTAMIHRVLNDSYSG